MAGESVHDLWQVLGRMDLDSEHSDGGLACLKATAPKELFPPVMRALMRMEAEEILTEPDTITEFGTRVRTEDQRRADAFLVLALRVAAAVRREATTASD